MKQIELILLVTKLLRETANLIVKEELLISESVNKYKYQHDDKSVSTICLENRKCSCAWYLEKAICKHLVAACIPTNSNLPGLVVLPKHFVTRWRKKNNYF